VIFKEDLSLYLKVLPILVAARSKAWVFGRSLAGITGSNTTESMVVCVMLRAVCLQAEVSVSG
jgi:hypothetical protein